MLARTVFWSIVASLIGMASVRADADVQLPLHAAPGGSLELSVTVIGQRETFLLDTGAAMVTINSELFKRLRRAGSVEKVRQVGARMADGRVRLMQVYRTDALQLDAACAPRSIEVLVVPGKGRNLLGMNVLSTFAPITLSMTPPLLGLSRCTPGFVASAPAIDHTGGIPATALTSFP